MLRRTAKKIKAKLYPNFRTTELSDLYTSLIGSSAGASTTCVIFSMDRAFQLHALLNSYYLHVQDPAPVHVLYRASSERHASAYREVFEIFKDRKVYAVPQLTKGSFRSQLIQLLEALTSSSIFFLVDDIVFTDSLRIADALQFDPRDYVVSLRLGAHLERCFTMNRAQTLPNFENEGSENLFWRWDDAELDWAYPLSVDGHFFRRAEILTMSRLVDFSAPNTYEGNLQVFGPYFKVRKGVCFPRAKLVNLAINKVQTVNDNLHGQIHQDLLLESWFKGKQMDISKFNGILNKSAHIDVEIEFIARAESSNRQ